MNLKILSIFKINNDESYTVDWKHKQKVDNLENGYVRIG